MLGAVERLQNKMNEAELNINKAKLMGVKNEI